MKRHRPATIENALAECGWFDALPDVARARIRTRMDTMAAAGRAAIVGVAEVGVSAPDFSDDWLEVHLLRSLDLVALGLPGIKRVISTGLNLENEYKIAFRFHRAWHVETLYFGCEVDAGEPPIVALLNCALDAFGTPLRVHAVRDPGCEDPEMERSVDEHWFVATDAAFHAAVARRLIRDPTQS